MFVALVALFFCYALSCFWLITRWLLITKRPARSDLPPHLVLTVVIPARNEAANIGLLLDDLLQQTLAKNQFEIIVANDASTDDTALIVSQFQAKNDLNVTLLSLPDLPTAAPKKRAITESLHIANGALIVTTDGDCRVGKRWLETIAQTYAQTGAKMISGPVVLVGQERGHLFDTFQTIEFSSLIGAGACLIEAGFPTMCNGANLAYERAAFEAVGGYANIDHLASGDDELLMQKIAQRFPQQIVFLKNREAIVRTAPQPTWQAFYQQRVRWGSKWNVNRRMATMAVAVFVFFVNSSVILSITAAAVGYLETKHLLFILALKYVPEFLFLTLIIRFLGQNKKIIYIPLVQLFYPFYVLFFGVAAQRKSYVWKNRSLQ